jgi:8-amino-7-oxononanoate synthase
LSWKTFAERELEALRAVGRLRRLKPFDADGVTGNDGSRELISFASNDYLGLSFHPSVRAAAAAAAQKWGAGSGASRLVTGTRNLHRDLEQAIADWKNTEDALVFPTGYAANLGVLTTLGGEDVTIFSDTLNHASIIDGCRLSKARVQIYGHLDMERLDELMSQTSGRKIVVSDSVFSMDGDVAPMDRLASLCVRHEALLVVDEAHAVLGPDVTMIEGLECLQVGTLSKTFGSLGGWVAGSRALIQLLVNRARSFIYTTGLSPSDAAAALAALQIYRSPEGERLRQQLRAAVDAIKPQHPSPIIPVILGDDRAALAAAELLTHRGLYAPAIRPPTVPRGTARLRIALSALHTPEMLTRLRHALAELASVSQPVASAT